MRCSVLHPTSCTVSAEVYNGLNTEEKGNRQQGGSDDKMIKMRRKSILVVVLHVLESYTVTVVAVNS